MKIVVSVATLLWASSSQQVDGFVSPSRFATASAPAALFAAPPTEEEKIKTVDAAAPPAEMVVDPDAEGLPWWWELVWKLDIMKLGTDGKAVIFGDSANVLRTNIEQIYGGYPSLDGCPLAEGDISDIADGTMFIGLQRYFNNYGSPYKLCFGPKSFLVVSDPVQARHLLRDANVNYDKVRIVYTHIYVRRRMFKAHSLTPFLSGYLGRNFGAHHGYGVDPS
jgi:hypothetical protein